jgi:hypothetical protein
MATKAEAVKAELEAIATANGGILTPNDVVEAAKNTNSALHDQFTWDTETAAHERRLDQARTIIRSVKIRFTVESRVISAPLYVRDPNSEPSAQGYTTLPRLLTDAEAARKAVIREFLMAEAAMDRAKSIAAVLTESETVDALLLGVRAFRERIEAGADASPAS